MMRVYISGKITGEPLAAVREKFEKAEVYLLAKGYQPVNPLKNGLAQESSWESHMRTDIKIMMNCEGIHMLSDWKFSSGATIEKRLAEDLKFEFIE